MALCTIDDVRNEDKKFSNSNDVTDAVITNRISRAEKIIKVDLSSVISESDIVSAGSDSNALNSLAIFKVVELTLVAYYGAGRKTDELTDVQYFKKEYKDLLNKILHGEVEIQTDTEEYSPKDYPAADGGSNKKFYIRKGVPDFLPEGEGQYGSTYVDDTVKD